MKKRLFSLFLALLTVALLVSLPFGAVAADDPGDDATGTVTTGAVTTGAETFCFLDAAGVITSDSKADEIEQKLKDVWKKYDCPVIIATVNGESSGSYESYAIALANEYDYAYNKAIVLVQFPDIRKYQIEMRGSEYSQKNVEKATGMLEDAILGHLQDDEYYEAYKAFASEASYILSELKDGGTLRDPYPWLRNILIAVIVALIVGAIYISSLKKKLKSVAYQKNATNYVRSGSMSVAVQKDIYLYSTVTRTARPKSTSSGGGGYHSGGGRSSGGGRGGGY